MSSASAVNAGVIPGSASLPSRYSFWASMIRSVELASGGGRRSAPASCSRVLAALMATLSSRQHAPQAIRAASRATPCRHQPSSAAGLRQLAHAQNVALPLGDGDDAARIQKVEDMARLDALVVGR